MAGDWIKMRTDLYRDPKVIVMAGLLNEKDGPLGRYVNQFCQRDVSVTSNVTRCAVVGALVAVWGVARHQGKRDCHDLVLQDVTLDVIDEICDLPGFGVAMDAVGWIVDDPEGLRFPRFFEENNVDPDQQKREQAARRKQRQRQRDKSVTVTRDISVTQRDIERDKSVTVTPREEKSREEKSVSSETSSLQKHSTVFLKPSVEEIRAYCQERKSQVDAQQFFDFYESKGWMVGRNKMRDWKACVRTWRRSLPA